MDRKYFLGSDIWNVPHYDRVRADDCDVNISVNKDRGKTVVRMSFYGEACRIVKGWEYAVASSLLKVRDLIYIMPVEPQDKMSGYKIQKGKNVCYLKYTPSEKEAQSIKEEWMGGHTLYRVRGENVFYIKKKDVPEGDAVKK